MNPWFSLLFSLDLHLKWAGLTLIFLGVSHAFFDGRFRWREEMARVSLLNRQIFFVHTFYIALVLVLTGLLCVVGTRGLLEKTFLGACLSGALCFFWATRVFCQFFVYSPQLWRGKRFETAMHALFAFAWCYYTLVFGWAFWHQMQ